MEQPNVTMDAEELIRYIEENNLEFQMLDILLFNTCGFDFAPIYKPRIDMIDMCCSLLDHEDTNLFGSDYQLPTFKFPIEKLPKNWHRYVNHPEHLYAYIVRHGDSVNGEFIYTRNTNASALVRNDAFKDFIEVSGLSNIRDFKKLARIAKKKRNSQYRKGIGHNRVVNLLDLLIDDRVIMSMQQSEEDPDEIIVMFGIRLLLSEISIYQNRYISIDNMISFPDDTESTISFSADFVPVKKNKTPLEQDFSIIDAEDQIPNILYQIAIETRATTFYAATGYTYESGIRMLLPSIQCVRGYDRAHSIELVIGDLWKYRPDVNQKSMNRATAEWINWMKDCYSLDHLYTCPDSFYHGKFYYISNGKTSHVIVGSSNITASAYTKNRELDVMFRFERGEDGHPCEQEQMFLDWYDDLKKNCTEISRLDETLFSSNLLIDEAGNSSSPSILKKLTSEEERERYRFLEGLHPSKINEKIFVRKKEFKAFQHYIAFFYPEKNITILESFRYGNSCFVLGTTDEKRIQMEVARKSKEQVKQSEIYISNVDHDEDYQSELHQIFGK